MYRALVGSLPLEIVPLITNASSSYEAWKILADTYASPSRGHIKQLQYHQTVTNYMHNVKTIVDELAILGKKLDQEDITNTVLNGLDQTTYKPILDAVHAKDSPISFNELHEKLINQELALAQQVTTSGIHQLASDAKRPWQPRHGSTNACLLPTPSKSHNQATGARPFLGKCQWCNKKGHSLCKRNCLLFKSLFPNAFVPIPNQNM
ncbi:hypothetical protein OSB04_017262 [Centaurea solstitialis]|uniref:Retrovirus-related Pol polyprotein from transposon TNT 1-94 n=1 Tax=Centaurea solstitialis TaxID=347529 RepID=A0AA38WAJ2_9ASTR|nr:hypothetical protein OSB04_017262 [Centaurea solstitialis]